MRRRLSYLVTEIVRDARMKVSPICPGETPTFYSSLGILSIGRLSLVRICSARALSRTLVGFPELHVDE